MTDALLETNIKIARAKKHLHDLTVETAEYLLGDPHQVVTEKDNETGEYVCKLSIRREMPPMWGAIVGDCLHNLRSAFDMLAHALVRHGGGTTSNYTKFPISSDVRFVNGDIASALVGASAKAIKLVRRLRPYQGGVGAFWFLHMLDIADKHRLLIPVVINYGRFRVSTDVGSPAFAITRLRMTERMIVSPGAELVRFRLLQTDDGRMPDFSFRFEMAFGKAEVVNGHPLISTLSELVSFTERVVAIFDRYILRSPENLIQDGAHRTADDHAAP